MKGILFAVITILLAGIANAQNVGIGTATPVTKLNVIGTGNSPAIPGIASTGIFRIGVATNEGIDFGKLPVTPYAAWMQAGFDAVTPDPLSLQPLGGNVGIGTISPSAKLEIAGQVKITGGVPAAGKVLTSDATGLASWQINAATATGNVGFGVWGDCSTNGNITEYNPVVDATGAADDNFGYSVSISGNYAIVGAKNDDIGANADQGSASIYQYSSGSWVLMQKITDATGAAGDNFGFSVSVSGSYAIVGSYGDDAGANLNQGSVSFYQLVAGNWVLMQKITDPAGGADDFLGVSVSISGNFAIAGALGDDVGANNNQGSASIFQLVGGTWLYSQKVTSATGAASDLFGISVSISGTITIIGALEDDIGAVTDQGSASIYRYNGTAFVFEQQLTDATGAAFDSYGTSVSISGNYAIVGADLDDAGAISDQGSASIYQYNGSSWLLMQKLTDPAGAASNGFGNSVSISGGYAVVGSHLDDVGSNTNQGSAIIYLRLGLAWNKLQLTTDPMGNAADRLGDATAFDSNTKQFLLSATGYANNSGKVIFGKVN